MFCPLSLKMALQRWEFIKENKKVRKQELDQESEQENKNTRTQPRKRSRKQENKNSAKKAIKKTRKQELDQEKKKKNFFFLDHFLGRVLVFLLSCFLL